MAKATSSSDQVTPIASLHQEQSKLPRDDYAAWREALAGGKPDMHADEPWVGYFKTRVPNAKEKLPKGRWPMMACAIFRGENGELQGERGGSIVPVEWLWPYVARYPIPYETYVYFHTHERWPDEEHV